MTDGVHINVRVPAVAAALCTDDHCYLFQSSVAVMLH